MDENEENELKEENQVKKETEVEVKEENQIEKESQTKEEKKEGLFKKVGKAFSKISKIIKIILVLAVVIIIIILGLSISNKMKSKSTLLEFGFKDVGQLVTQEWYGRMLENKPFDRKIFNKFPIPLTTSRLIFSLDVEVLAGLDFSKIEWELKDENTLKIKLPKAQIYKYYKVQGTFESYLDDESWFNNINSQLISELEDEVVKKGKDKALETGLLDKADKNAKVIIEQMVKAKNKDLNIEWEYKE